MGDGINTPLTREDVLELIKKNGGKADGLNLSMHKFTDAIDLSGFDLAGVKLDNAKLFRANFNGANLDRALMRGANLQHATFNPLGSKKASLKYVGFCAAKLGYAEFRYADLNASQFYEEESEDLLPAYLENTDFRGANLFLAGFKGCYFYGTKLEGVYIRGADIFEAHLEYVDWGNHMIGDELAKDFSTANSYYRRLRIWYTERGMYATAAKFYYREKETSRKATPWRSDKWRYRLGFSASRVFFGYGESWFRALAWAVALIFVFALVFFFSGAVSGNFLDSLHFSAVSFASAGYGSWFTPDSISIWARVVGVFESFVGFGIMTLILVTFFRKWTR